MSSDSVSEAVTAVPSPNPSRLANSPSPSSPYTTDGIAARFAMFTWSSRVSDPRIPLPGMYSSKKTEVPTPRTNDSTATSAMMITEPTIAG